MSDGELFYVMSHKKDQSGQKRFATLPGIDHDIGTDQAYKTITFSFFPI